jgi:hypothetical protein
MTKNNDDLHLNRDAFGKLILGVGDQVYDNVIPVRGFPISAPNAGIALVGEDGGELAWIESLDDLSESARELLIEELENREFIPQILHIRYASSMATPSLWKIDTDRGPTELVLRAEEDIRRLSGGALLIADTHGVQYLIRNVTDLDKSSRRILDHFL